MMSERPDEQTRNCSWSMCRRRRTGSVLILVVWTIALLSVLAVGIGSRGAFSLGFTERMGEDLPASYMAAPGVQHAVQVLAMDKQASSDGLSDVWANNESLLSRQAFGGGTFTISAPSTDPSSVQYGLIDQERLLNLNTATPEMLVRLLSQTGSAKLSEALMIADAILDWRDKDKDARPSGAENSYYLGLSPSYECKDAPFQSVEELLLVRGVPPAIYRRVRPFLTVYGSGAVNINTAGEAVLSALGLSAQGVQGILWYRAGEDNTAGTEDDRVLASIAAATGELGRAVPVEDRNRLVQLGKDQLVGVKSTVFAVHVSAQVDGAKRPVQVDAMVDRKGQVLAWAEH